MRPESYISPTVDSLDIVDRELLQPAGLDLSQVDRAMGALMSRQLTYGDIYFQFTRFETWAIEDGIVKDGVHSVDQASVYGLLPPRKPGSPTPTNSTPRRLTMPWTPREESFERAVTAVYRYPGRRLRITCILPTTRR